MLWRLIFISLAATTLCFVTCSVAYLGGNPWATKPKLESVSTLQPHGMLIVKRNDQHLFVLVNERAVFKGDHAKTSEARVCLAPGVYIIKAQYYRSEGKVTHYSDVAEGTIVISENGISEVWVEYWGSDVRIRLYSSTGGHNY